MRIMAVDDERLALESLLDVIHQVTPAAEAQGFQHPSAALRAAEEWRPDVALLDIDMRSMSGVDLARQLQKLAPRVNIVFTTGYDSYTKEAMAMHASGYLLKPITVEKLRQELAVLRFSVQNDGETAADEQTDRICVRTFGNFEVFFRGQPLHFQYHKTRELLAYLIDRNGALCSNREIISILWEDCDAAQKMPYLQRLRSDLTNALRECGAEDILFRQRGGIGVLTEQVDCDYYAWLRGEVLPSVPGGGGYHGEYMAQYSWAEPTNGYLQSMKKRK